MSHQSDLIQSDILSYLKQHESKELLRFLTCGSVDDGKSTLIGRLLHDSKIVYEDQLAAVAGDSKRVGTQGEKIDLALLVDGLQAEREQGITIDVAYRYFSTEKRKFIIADTPGHEQYTRNMATGASTCDLAVILIDARYGVVTQTRRHSFIASLLGIKHIVVAVNKMDLVEYQQDVFENIRNDYLDFAESLEVSDIRFVPVSALEGDNVVNASRHMGWYSGSTLMQLLESVDITHDHDFDGFRFPVQYVNRPNHEFRGFSGTVVAGEIRPGDTILALPSGKASRVKDIVTFGGDLPKASFGQAITLTLEDEIDISRGDMLVSPDARPLQAQELDAEIVWMGEQPLKPGRQYDIKLGTVTTAGQVSKIHHQIDVNSFEQHTVQSLSLNEIGYCRLSLSRAVTFDAYRRNRSTGSFIVIDRVTNETVGAGMINGAVRTGLKTPVTVEERAARFGQTPQIIQVKSASCQTLALLERELFDRGVSVAILPRPEFSQEQLLRKLGFIVLTRDAASPEAMTLDSQKTSEELLESVYRCSQISTGF
ncbi:sulfate adenylyltransferase subunit CysN [Sansalvadorimonas sp. 2012CJ34-2]|uniref:Sulfate adenylyltransferase subunit 1 n=1 Tax=Parendozoicomonas callyspongiae TaxID=2942213 RepID=A0ABT0PE93_9GAMM|nr:sulfate adenylyltransferase subunit CysN [Sansalvadorimonas sp. 2012CJ34-2]MCL6268873.1 sulfate adenylyltransferase subunit CysN [Sansalvadorimonas sp. 2012CJ34-2]